MTDTIDVVINGSWTVHGLSGDSKVGDVIDVDVGGRLPGIGIITDIATGTYGLMVATVIGAILPTIETVSYEDGSETTANENYGLPMEVVRAAVEHYAKGLRA